MHSILKSSTLINNKWNVNTQDQRNWSKYIWTIWNI